MKNRILMLLENNSYPDDTRVLLEANSLSEAGYQVTVVCPSDGNKLGFEQVADVRVYRYPSLWEGSGIMGYLVEFSYSLIMAWVFTLYICLRRGLDVIHVHAPPDMNALEETQPTK